jgi:hypothetical protein
VICISEPGASLSLIWQIANLRGEAQAAGFKGDKPMTQCMRISAAVAAMGVALGAASCASPAATDTAATTQAGRCINPTRIQKQEIVSDREIRFVMDTGDVWVNTLKRECHGLKFEGGFSWDVRGTQVCADEQVITVLNAGTTCMLGAFTKAPAAPA